MAMERQGRHVRLPQTRWMVMGVIAAVVASLFATDEVDSMLGNNPAFLPSVLSVIAFSQALTALMLVQKFLAGGQGRLVGIAAAYLFAALMIVPHVLTFPGLVTPNGVFDPTPSTPTWFWVAWHTGFPALLAIAVATGGWAERWTITQSRRRIAVVVSAVATTALVLALSCFIVLARAHLPVIITNGNYSALVEVAGSWVIGVNVIATLLAIYFCRRSEGTLAWLPVAAIASLADVCLSLFGEARYTVGWYGGRSLSVFTATIVLAALMFEFTRLYRASEENRRALEDEALDLLRENRAALYREDRVRRVIENAADAYIEINRSGRIQAWNGKATDLFGWNNSEVESQQFVETVMAEEGWPQFRELIEDFWTSDDRFDGSYAELLVSSGDGREFPAEATLWVDESDFEPRMSFFLRDITIRRETQEKLQKALNEEREAVLRMQEIDRVKSNFVSSVSHELRSPLTNTLGYLELLADGDVGELTENQLHMVNVAQRNAHRLFSLIEDLLILSRVEEGAFSVRFRAVAMHDVLDVVTSSNQAFANERNVALSIDVDDSVGVCPGDAKQLTRALSNIVNNAVKFSDKGGRVDIVARQSHDEIELIIRDSGIGVPFEEQSKLFERFFRTSISVEAQHQGAGLGLTITKTIIDHHGGSIAVDSKLGHGTTVTVRLPAMQTMDALVTEVAPA